jgi:hypothetical protein
VPVRSTAEGLRGDHGRTQQDGAGVGVRMAREARDGEVGAVGLPERDRRSRIEAVHVGGVAFEHRDRAGFCGELLLVEAVLVAP